MKCNSCNEDVNEKLQYALSQNVCPFCGKNILSKDEHFFRKSLTDILRNRGIQEEKLIKDITADLIDLLNSDDTENSAKIVSSDELTIPNEKQKIVSTAAIQIDGRQTDKRQVDDRIILPHPKVKKPPKRINIKSEQRDPISTGNFVPPDMSMDMEDISREIGGATPEEEAEIRGQIERGEIVFKTL